MKERTYSQNIANAIKEFLTNDDWYFSFDEKRGMFKFGLCLKGKIKKIDYLICVRDDEYIVYAISPIGANENNEKMMTAMAEFVCRANYGLKNGNFELDMRDGEIRFKCFVDCDTITPTQEMVRNSILCPAAMFDNYSDGIVGIIFGDMSAKEAVEQCESCNDDRLSSALASLCAEDEDGELSAMLSRLAARMGIEGLESVPEQVEDSSEIVDHIKTGIFADEGGAA